MVGVTRNNTDVRDDGPTKARKRPLEPQKQDATKQHRVRQQRRQHLSILTFLRAESSFSFLFGNTFNCRLLVYSINRQQNLKRQATYFDTKAAPNPTLQILLSTSAFSPDRLRRISGDNPNSLASVAPSTPKRCFLGLVHNLKRLLKQWHRPRPTRHLVFCIAADHAPVHFVLSTDF